MTKKSKYYKVGLDPEIRQRSQIIFGVLTVVFLVALGWGTYAGIKTGKFNQVLVNPIKDYFKNLAAMPDVPEPFFDDYESTPSSNVNILINNGDNAQDYQPTSKPTSKPAVDTYTNTTTYPVVDTKSFEQRVQEQNAAADKAYQDALKKQQEWSAAQKAANDKWFQEQTAKSEAESKAWYDEQVQKAQQDLEAWKKEHGF